ncbi:subtilisin-like protein [Thozetella sp. PMI_491]|nr:subtilisin-like protein [Thozetella sp. PMI_491]
MKDDEFNNSYDHIKFSDVLCYVAVGAVKLQRTAQANTSKSPRGRDLVKPGLGRTCLTILFDWLRKKGVKKILKVIVDDSIADDNLDLLRPGVPHTDDAIEQALHPFHVEMLDWRKPDMCPQMIRSASDELRELWLTWGGNNTILRAWSAQDGLPLLEKLERNQPDRGRQTHRWLACMDDFADRIQNINPAKLDAMKNEKLGQPIKVALIDDGVNTSHRTIQGKIQGGMSFDPGLENRPSPYYVTETGHGTVMADLICRVCPVAKLQIFKLETYIVDHNNGGETNRKTQITARSAAQAIEAAVERHADIISMSWTIKNSDKQSDELKLLETAMQKAIDAKILVFCSASDEGTFRNTSDYPSHTHASRVFRIGAATVDGVPCTWVDREVEFILPGQDVSERRTSISEPTKPFRPMTGSSVATALAAGLAALILHCVKLAAIAEGDLVKKEDLDDMHGYAKMKGAFNRMTPKDSKFIEVSELFGEKEVKDLDECSNDDTKKLVVVADIARKLVDSAKLSSR